MKFSFYCRGGVGVIRVGEVEGKGGFRSGWGVDLLVGRYGSVLRVYEFSSYGVLI